MDTGKKVYPIKATQIKKGLDLIMDIRKRGRYLKNRHKKKG